MIGDTSGGHAQAENNIGIYAEEYDQKLRDAEQNDVDNEGDAGECTW